MSAPSTVGPLRLLLVLLGASLGSFLLLSARRALPIQTRRRNARANPRATAGTVVANRPDASRILQADADDDARSAAHTGFRRHRRLGELLVQAELLTESDLTLALDAQAETGTRLGEVLLQSGAVTGTDVAWALSRQLNVPLARLEDFHPNSDTPSLLPHDVAWRYRCAPLKIADGVLDVATSEPLSDELRAFATRALNMDVREHVAPLPTIERLLESTYARFKLEESTFGLLRRNPEESAFRVLSGAQKVTFGALAVGLGVALAWKPMSALIAVNFAATLLFISLALYRFKLVNRALARRFEVTISPEELSAVEVRDLATYTILVPLYREAAVVPRLVASLERLDYPPTKLDIKLIVEEDDDETLAALRQLPLARQFKTVVVPDGRPKTKPKACNYALMQTEGEYVVIYDAEDRPEVDQLKKMVVAFSKVSKDVVCLQCKLNYYNRTQNLLTRWFTSEYSMWFDLFLPALVASGAPIPLGGTSNHFRVEALREVGAWDPFNVTEDADLGVRLHKAGYRTAVVDSTTFEEANSALGNWVRQRSRWVKGYIQTWLVQMRHPIDLLRQLGWRGWLSFQLVVGGTFASVLLSPIYWVITGLWFATAAGLIEAVFPAYVYFIAGIALFVGNFVVMYITSVAVIYRGYHDLVKYSLLSPLYWGLMSIGAWKGLVQLVYRASYWEKTAHGLDQGAREPQVIGEG